MQDKKYAVIDIGSNSVRLLVASGNAGRFTVLYKDLVYTRLGQNAMQEKKLMPEAIKRTVAGIDTLCKKAKAHGAEVIYAFATSAARDASNKDELVSAAREIGVDIDIISGREEAAIGYTGATSLAGSGSAGIIDIGGGSTEIITGNGGVPGFIRSYQIGAVRCYDRFPSGAPSSRAILTRMRAYVKKQFAGMRAEINSIGQLPSLWIGIGGTATTFAAIDLEMRIYDGARLNGHVLTYRSLSRTVRKLAGMTTDERKFVPGVPSFNADIIVTAGSILMLIMEELDIDSITASDSDNLNGYLIMKTAGGINSKIISENS